MSRGNDGMTEIKGIITKGVGGLYEVRPVYSVGRGVGDDGVGKENGGNAEDHAGIPPVLSCRARGRFRSESITPMVGDEVTVTESDDADRGGDADGRGRRKSDADASGGEWVVDSISPRRTELIRPSVANLTHLFLLLPAAKPLPDLLMADKLTAASESAGIEPVVVIGKADLDEDGARELAKIYQIAGYRTFVLSSETGEGIGELKAFLTALAAASKDTVTAAFAGVSGAGKSTLMTALFPGLRLVAGSVSRKTERGRHTTRSVELFPLSPDGEHIMFIADTPGFSMLDFARYNFFPAAELAENFKEFADCLGRCRYTKCTHTKEEGCAVLEKLKNGGVSASRHDNYVRIYEELRATPEWKRKKKG